MTKSQYGGVLILCSLLVSVLLLCRFYTWRAVEVVPKQSVTGNVVISNGMDLIKPDVFNLDITRPLSGQSHEEFLHFCSKAMALLPYVDKEVQMAVDKDIVERIDKVGRGNFVRVLVSLISENRMDSLYIPARDAPYFVTLFKFELISAGEVKKQLEDLDESGLQVLSSAFNMCSTNPDRTQLFKAN